MLGMTYKITRPPHSGVHPTLLRLLIRKIRQDMTSFCHYKETCSVDTPFYLCYLHLQCGSDYGQDVAGDDQQVPAVQEFTLVVLTHTAIVVFLQESGESLRMN